MGWPHWALGTGVPQAPAAAKVGGEDDLVAAPAILVNAMVGLAGCLPRCAFPREKPVHVRACLNWKPCKDVAPDMLCTVQHAQEDVLA
eukprot:5999970-Alexandrium_andersonii.AAC.1